MSIYVAGGNSIPQEADLNFHLSDQLDDFPGYASPVKDLEVQRSSEAATQVIQTSSPVVESSGHRHIPGHSHEPSTCEKDSDDSYHPPIRSSKKRHHSESLDSDRNPQAEGQSSVTPGEQSSAARKRIKIIAEENITVNDILKPEVMRSWNNIKRQLNFALAHSKTLHVEYNERKVRDANGELGETLHEISSEMTEFAARFRDLACSMDSATETSDMQCFLHQEAYQQEQLTSQITSDAEEKEVPFRHKGMKFSTNSKCERNQRQRTSDAEVKGIIQVVRTEKGNKKYLYKCNVCGQFLCSRSHLHDHLRRHTGACIYCPQCSMKLKSQRRMREHLEYHSRGPWVCEICEKAGTKKEYMWQASFANHMRRHR